MIRGLVDTFEDEYVILELEDGAYAKVRIEDLPDNIREGDEVQIEEDLAEILL